MKALILLVFGAIVLIQISGAQTLSPSVISSSGSFYQDGNGMLSSTVGEMTMIETFPSGNSILTQGFQQPFDFSVGMSYEDGNNFIDIFPNPSSGNMTISWPVNSPDVFEVFVFDAIGKMVFRKKVFIQPLSKNIHLSLDELIAGMYIIQVNTKSEKYFKKINIIK
jgi:hypothetical protein